jgi:hypothetical protein
LLLSTALLAEYREVLMRPRIRKLHGLAERGIDLLLTEMARHAIVREPAPASGASDPKDNHLWALVEYKSGKRVGYGTAVMTEVVADMSDADLQDVAHHLAHFPVHR